ncbi:MAG: GNAT family N-acetyltransferase, partial [Planctomycetales bacterium]|nr:GNAT family N-acetyltransferase [Planctomycetales bacterium]
HRSQAPRKLRIAGIFAPMFEQIYYLIRLTQSECHVKGDTLQKILQSQRLRYVKTKKKPPVQLLIRDLAIEEYQNFVDQHPQSIVFHHRRWLELLCDQHGFGLHLPAVTDGTSILAAIPFLETKSIFGKRKLISLPFTDSVGLLGDSKALAALTRRLTSSPYDKFDTIVIRTNQPTSVDSADPAWVRHTIALDRPFEQVYSGFERRLKTNLRRARKSDLTFSCHTSAEAVQEFYNLQLMTRRRLGVPVQPRRFFCRLRERLLEEGFGHIALVRQGTKTVAAGVFLHYNGTMIYKYSAADPSALECRPNEFLTYNAIKRSIELGCHLFDFGISNQSQDGLRRYKRKFGATEETVYREFITGEQRPLTEDSAAMTFASALIRNSPFFVCRALGETFYRYSQ